VTFQPHAPTPSLSPLSLHERSSDLTQPELLAYHYTEAGLPAQAVPYWQQAGQCAVERSANVEAVSHFTQGLEVLKLLPATRERRSEEHTSELQSPDQTV